MTAEIVPLFPTSIAEHGPCRTFRQAVADKLRAGTMTPGGAVAALVVWEKMSWREAADEVDDILRRIAE